MNLSFSQKGHSTKHKLALPKYSLLHKIGRDFVVDWLLMLAVATFVSLLFIAVGYMKYMSSNEIINTENMVQPTSANVRFDDNKLDTIMDLYSDKTKDREAVNSGQYKISDPAL